MAFRFDMLSAQQALDPARDIKFVVPYPYSSNIGISANRLEPRLSVLSAMSVLAAVAIHKAQANPDIVIPGETPFGRPNTSDLMVDSALWRGVKEDSLFPLYDTKNGRKLNNTYLQSEAVVDYFDRDLSDVLVLGLSYHMRRIQSSLRAHNARGIQPAFAPVDSIVRDQYDKFYDPLFDTLEGLKRSEAMARLLTVRFLGLDKGQLLNFGEKLTGPRIVDVSRNGDRTYTLEDTFARTKETRLNKKLKKQMEQKGD